MRLLWAGGPKPHRATILPIHIGGSSRATEPEQQRDELSAFAERCALLDHLFG